MIRALPHGISQHDVDNHCDVPKLHDDCLGFERRAESPPLEPQFLLRVEMGIEGIAVIQVYHTQAQHFYATLYLVMDLHPKA
jgi:hypothetical protein